ncbi:hypothetical protein [Legionella oakridgensis]|uniref:Dot/Icm secretion system substrate n=1 Tax=Legionella oakridgensis TaxID=29423 RepID=A0A0W0X292_9GAMM|nr:hypothetical protein [Legionella oakridgensis]KTD38687.1 Dot/Icm secretion system substrate [Legionella oakridgensis]STY20871.1 Dot/Icm T4SS effector [Legionella longbeachae]
METYEHKAAGDQIRVEKVENPYLRGSDDLSPSEKNKLFIKMMQTIDSIPVPLDLELSAGDVIALAGDYYTLPGWGKQLQLPPRHRNVVAENEQLFHEPVLPGENAAFHSAYSDLASPSVKKRDVDRIYAIEKRTYIPFFSSLNSLIQQLVYSWTVKDYGKKLNENEAHFAPWSARAYIVGHHTALQNAQLAFYCEQLANGSVRETDEQIPQALRDALQKSRLNPAAFKLQEQIKDNKTLYNELMHRYHALAIGQDLFAMHFYSDHYAGGHISRIGRLRQSMPEQFGVWGSILINNMHNEDNSDGVTVTDPFQPERHAPYTSADKPFRMIREDNVAYGDGTYLQRDNAENSNMLINGMDNSLGDIYLARTTGEIRRSQDYGGLAFLPEIDYSKRQTQPLLIQGQDGTVYVRSNLSQIRMLSPTEYQRTLQNPQDNDYEKLTYWGAFKLVFKLRVLGFIYSPKIMAISPEREQEIQQDEQRFEHHTTSKSLRPASREHAAMDLPHLDQVGAWRMNPLASKSGAGLFDHRIAAFEEAVTQLGAEHGIGERETTTFNFT